MISKNLDKIFFLLIFLAILIVAYPVTYFLIETPYYSCSQYFSFLKNPITELNNPEYSECIKVERADVEAILPIFLYWFLFFGIFFIILNKIINLDNLDLYFKKIKINSNFLFYLSIFFAPIIFTLSIFIDIGRFNFIFLLNKVIFYYFLFFFFSKDKKIFYTYFGVSLIPIFLGEISNSIYLFLILFYLSVFKDLHFKKIVKSLIIFIIFFLSIIYSQDNFKKRYGYGSIIKYKVSFEDGKLRLKKNEAKKLSDSYFQSQLKYNDRYIYFKLSKYIDNEYLNLLYNRTLRRLSEINHTIIFDKLFKTNNADLQKGKTYQRLPVLLVPRIIYPSKPSETYGNILICEYGIGNPFKTKKECFEKNTTSINLNVLLEGYLNYRYPGLIFSSFFMALLAVFAFNLLKNREYYLNILGACVMYQSIMYQSNLTGVLGGVILTLVAVFPVLILKQINEK